MPAIGLWPSYPCVQMFTPLPNKNPIWTCQSWITLYKVFPSENVTLWRKLMPCWLIPTEMALNHAWLRSSRVKMRMRQSVMPETCNDSRSLNIAGTNEKSIGAYIFWMLCLNRSPGNSGVWSTQRLHVGPWPFWEFPDVSLFGTLNRQSRTTRVIGISKPGHVASPNAQINICWVSWAF